MVSTRWTKDTAPKRPDKGASIRLGAISSAILLEALVKKGCTHKMLVELTGMASSTVRSYVSQLMKRGLVRIIGRKPDEKGHMTILLFRFDPENTVPDEEWRMSSAQRSRKYRALRNLKKNGAIERDVMRRIVQQAIKEPA